MCFLHYIYLTTIVVTLQILHTKIFWSVKKICILDFHIFGQHTVITTWHIEIVVASVLENSSSSTHRPYKCMSKINSTFGSVFGLHQQKYLLFSLLFGAEQVANGGKQLPAAWEQGEWTRENGWNFKVFQNQIAKIIEMSNVYSSNSCVEESVILSYPINNLVIHQIYLATPFGYGCPGREPLIEITDHG